jgi:hypothetical protein
MISHLWERRKKQQGFTANSSDVRRVAKRPRRSLTKLDAADADKLTFWIVMQRAEQNSQREHYLMTLKRVQPLKVQPPLGQRSQQRQLHQNSPQPPDHN